MASHKQALPNDIHPKLAALGTKGGLSIPSIKLLAIHIMKEYHPELKGTSYVSEYPPEFRKTMERYMGARAHLRKHFGKVGLLHEFIVAYMGKKDSKPVINSADWHPIENAPRWGAKPLVTLLKPTDISNLKRAVETLAQSSGDKRFFWVSQPHSPFLVHKDAVEAVKLELAKIERVQQQTALMAGVVARRRAALKNSSNRR